MSDDYRRERNRAKLRADGGFPSLIICLVIAASGSGVLYAVWMFVNSR